MESLPLDTSHPAVRDYLALVRLQVLTPLSLLINIATVAVCAAVVSPSITHIARLKTTAISPSPFASAIYVAVIYAGQIGYCILLVLASKQETKRTLIKAVGLSLVFANWLMALWAVAWVLQLFLVATVCQGLLLLLLVYSNITLLIYHSPTSSRPFDTALIHAPLRFFLILPLLVLFPLSLFITLHFNYQPSGPPADYADYHAWPAFAVVISTNLLALLTIILRRDIVCCVAATWVCVSLWVYGTKPAQVYITTILFTALHPLALVVSLVYAHYFSPPQPVALQGGERPLRNGPNQVQTPNPDGLAREVDVEGLWRSS